MVKINSVKKKVELLLRGSHEIEFFFSMAGVCRPQLNCVQSLCEELLKVDKVNYVLNPSIYFPIVSFLAQGGAKWDSMCQESIQELTSQEFVAYLLNRMFLKFEGGENNEGYESFYGKILTFSDKKLVSLKEEKFSVFESADESLLDGVSFVKINHGYWEFLLNTFAVLVDADDLGVRDLRESRHIRNWQVSGFNCALKSLFKAWLSYESKSLKFAVSIRAGDKPFSKAIEPPFTKVERGALIGLLGFVEEISKDKKVNFYDGYLPKKLVDDNSVFDFFDNYINEFESAVLVSPPSLDKLKLNKFKGDFYKFIIPGQTVHECFYVIVCSFIGYLLEILDKCNSVIVLNQSAVFSAVLAICIDVLKIEGVINKKCIFVDLGRVLDLSDPNISLNWRAFSYLKNDKYFFSKMSNFITLSKGDSERDYFFPYV